MLLSKRRMRLRSRTLRDITLLGLCHWILFPTLLTSQLPQAATLSQNEESGEPVTISAESQEKNGDLYTLRGAVEIEWKDFRLFADEITYNQASGQATATGHVRFEGGEHDERIEATRGEYNLKAQTGKFYDVMGSTGVKFRGKNVTLTTDQPFLFTGKVVEKLAPDHYVVTGGTVTSCQLPKPKWRFHSGRVDIHLGGKAKIYNTTFRIKDIPVLFLPYASHPVTKLGRQSGFLIPTIGTSSRKGTILGDSFYWVMGRSADATLGLDYYSSRGWAPQAEFRARPAENTTIQASYFGVFDRGFGAPPVNQGGQDVKLNVTSLMPLGVRGVVSAEYLSNFVFRQAFTDTYAQAVNSEVRSVAFLTKDIKGFYYNLFASRYQNYQSNIPDDLITLVRAPSFEINSAEHRLGPTPFTVAFSGAADGVSRRSPAFKTADLLGRFDVNPRIALPLFLRGWTFRAETGLRNTYYTQRKGPGGGVGIPLTTDLNRRALEASFEVRPPTLGRIFDRPLWGQTWKHTIEPEFTFRQVNGVENFANIIRFDETDILSDTSEVEYGVTNRLYAKKAGAARCDPAAEKPCDTGAREVLGWEILQRYYFDDNFGNAVIKGQRNMLTSTAQLSGIAFLTEPRKFSPIVSRLRVRVTRVLDASWELDYDTKKGRINLSNTYVSYRAGDQFFFGAGHTYFQAPGEVNTSSPTPSVTQFDQVRFLAGYGNANKRGWSTSAGIGFDSRSGFLEYGSFRGGYNWDCCGLTGEYRRFALGQVRNENQFRFAFTLANIGTFGNLKRNERLY